jgi:hypothetical protein
MNLSLFDNADQNHPSRNVTLPDLHQIITGPNLKNITKRTKQLATELRDAPDELKPTKKEALRKAKLQSEYEWHHAERYSGLGRSPIYNLLGQRKIKSRTIRTIRVVDRESIDSMIEAQPA